MWFAAMASCLAALRYDPMQQRGKRGPARVNGNIEASAHSCVESLLRRYPALDRSESRRAVLRAYEALRLFGLLGDSDATGLWFACAEREVRLRLGFDVEEARLDPQPHGARARLSVPDAECRSVLLGRGLAVGVEGAAGAGEQVQRGCDDGHERDAGENREQGINGFQ